MSTDADGGERPLIGVIHGPNLNLLGVREPDKYGHDTLADIDADLTGLANDSGYLLEAVQHNGEGELVTAIQGFRRRAVGILINPAAYTHTSVAIRDALLAIDLPTIEIHLSNTHAREPFRHHSTIADIVVGRVMGFGRLSYALGLRGLIAHLGSTGVLRQSQGS